MSRWSDSDSGVDEYEDGAYEYEYPDDDIPEEMVEVSEGREEAVSGDSAVGAAITRAGSSAAGAAKGAGRSLAGGLSALKQVRNVSRQRANARAHVRDIEQALDDNRALLVHREDITRNYDEIVATQTTAIEVADAEITEAKASIEEQEARRRKLDDELRRMKERHEQKLRPYRNLMDSTRGRSDDAAKALANARRATKNAEAAVNDATKRRVKRISDAHHAVDNAKERLRAVEAERDTLRADGATDTAAITKIESECAAERANLENATADVARITQEAQASVDQAQQDLWVKQREQASAEKVAEAAKEEAMTHKNEYDGMFKEAQAKERAREDAIKSCDSRIKDLTKTKNAAEARKREAEAILNEAEEIHAHPETTEGLRQRIANEEADLESAEVALDEITIMERDLRRDTRAARVIFVVVAVLVAKLIVFLIWFFLLRK